MSHAIHCLNCGYEVGQERRICPECGGATPETLVDINEARAQATRSTNDVIIRFALSWGAICIVYAGGAGLLVLSIQAALFAGGLLVGFVTMSAAIGALIAFMAPVWHRRFVFLAWVRALWWMHAPWLVVSLGAGFIVIVGLVDANMELDGGLVTWVALAGVSLWFLMCFVFLYRAFETCFDRLGRWWPPSSMERRRDWVGAMLGMAIFAVLIGAGLIAIAGGTLCVGTALTFGESAFWAM